MTSRLLPTLALVLLAGCGSAVTSPDPLSTLWAQGAGDPVASDDAPDAATSILSDAHGNVYVAGPFVRSLDLGKGAMAGDVPYGAIFCFIAKLTPDGAPVWTRTLQVDSMTLAMGDDGNLWAAGKYTYTPEIGIAPKGLPGLYAARLDGDGNLLWARPYGSTADAVRHVVRPTPGGGAALIASLGGSAVFDVAGTSVTGAPEATYDGVVFSLDPQGDVRWARSLAAAIGADVLQTDDPTDALDMAVAGSGDVVVAGGLSVTRFDTSGNVVWTRTGKPVSPPMGIPAINGMTAALDIDRAGRIVVAGVLPQGGVDFGGGALDAAFGYVVSLDAGGHHRWSRKNNIFPAPAGPALDADGDIFLAGGSQGGAPDFAPGLGPGAFVVELSSDGDYLAGVAHPPKGLNTYADPNVVVTPMALSVDPGGAVLLGGSYVGGLDLGTGPLPPVPPMAPAYYSNLFFAKLAP